MVPGVTDEMIQAAQCGDADALWSVVSAHDPIIRRIIRQVAPDASAEDAEDLLQEGRAELIRRVRSYDSDATSAQLQTYAYSHMRRAIAEAHVRATTGVTVDPTAVLRVRRAIAHHDGNVEAAFLSVNARFKMSRETFVSVREALDSTVDWDCKVNNELTLADVTQSATGDFTEATERRQLAHHLLSVVSRRQSYALAAYHGVGMMPTTDADVAGHLRMAARSVRQLRSDGARSARSWAADHDIYAAA